MFYPARRQNRRNLSPFSDFDREMNDIFKVFEDLFPDLSASKFVTGFQGAPIADVLMDESGNLKYEIAVTGLEPKDIDISIEDGCLTVSAEVKEEGSDKEWKYVHHKLVRKSFQKSFTIPKQADIEKITADISNGLLSISIPLKEEEKKEVKKIQINQK